jgi:hypothetical protein
VSKLGRSFLFKTHTYSNRQTISSSHSPNIRAIFYLILCTYTIYMHIHIYETYQLYQSLFKTGYKDRLKAIFRNKCYCGHNLILYFPFHVRTLLNFPSEDKGAFVKSSCLTEIKMSRLKSGNYIIIVSNYLII